MTPCCPPKDRTPAPRYYEVPLASGGFRAVLPVQTPTWYTDTAKLLVINCDGDGLPESCALADDFL